MRPCRESVVVRRAPEPGTHQQVGNGCMVWPLEAMWFSGGEDMSYVCVRIRGTKGLNVLPTAGYGLSPRPPTHWLKLLRNWWADGQIIRSHCSVQSVIGPRTGVIGSVVGTRDKSFPEMSTVRGSPGEEGLRGILGGGHGPGKGTGSEGVWPFMVDDTESTVTRQVLSPYGVSGSTWDQKLQAMPHPYTPRICFLDPEIQEGSAQATIPLPRGEKNPKAKL